MSTKTFIACLSAVLCAACAGGSPRLVATPVPSTLVPAGETLVSAVSARGVQIYECRAKRGDPSATEWAFIAPEADLFDERGQPAGKHYAGPRWDARDGSTIAGTVLASAVAPRSDSIPWLLLSTHSVGGAGRFAAVTSVQRLDTAGGTAPAAGCNRTALGQTVRVPYAAVYTMFAKSSETATTPSQKSSSTL